MDFQEYQELQSEEFAKWDYIAELKEEHRDRCEENEPIDMAALRKRWAELAAEREAEGLPDELRAFDDEGKEICF